MALLPDPNEQMLASITPSIPSILADSFYRNQFRYVDQLMYPMSSTSNTLVTLLGWKAVCTFTVQSYACLPTSKSHYNQLSLILTEDCSLSRLSICLFLALLLCHCLLVVAKLWKKYGSVCKAVANSSLQTECDSASMAEHPGLIRTLTIQKSLPGLYCADVMTENRFISVPPEPQKWFCFNTHHALSTPKWSITDLSISFCKLVSSRS